jgi:signal transduction histidine kinase/FixJ family two-component response regulator
MNRTSPNKADSSADAPPEPQGMVQAQGNILVVDDTVSNLKILSTTLTGHGFDVRVASDGPTALMLAQAEPPDLILLDIRMPEMDGYEVCRRLKTIRLTGDIPIIFVSALDETIDKVKGFELGGVDYINKPFQAEEVLARVRTHLSVYKLQAALQKRVTELSALHRITRTMATGTELPEALNTVAEIITYLFQAETTLITMPAAEDAKLQILAEYRHRPTSLDAVPLNFPLDEMQETPQVLDNGRSLVLSDVQARSLSPAVCAYFEALELQTIMLVSLQVSGRSVGTLVIGAKQAERTFTADEVILAETVAGDIAAAIKNAQLSEQAQVVAISAERQRLARELHDSVTQSLYSLTLLTNGWRTMAAEGRLNQQQVVDSFKQLGDVGQQGLKEMRLLIHQLRPAILEEAGLIGALQQRLDAVEQRVNMETHLYARGAVDELPLNVAEQLYYIALEALNNSVRHARTTTVTIDIRAEDDEISLSVRDNGIGFDPTAPSPGMGLTTIQERAESIGAEVSITSAPQQGAAVEITVADKPDKKV